MTDKVVDASAVVAVAFNETSREAVVALAERTALSVYDASYLWLARALDAELVTSMRG